MGLARHSPAPRISVMVKRISHVRLACVCFVTLTASAALSQSEQPSRLANSLPDAPSAQVSISAHRFQPTIFGASRPILMASLPKATPFDETLPPRKTSEPLFFKHLYSPSASSNSRYRASDSDTLLGRATDAASRIFVTQDEAGRPGLAMLSRPTSFSTRSPISAAALLVNVIARIDSGITPFCSIR